MRAWKTKLPKKRDILKQQLAAVLIGHPEACQAIKQTNITPAKSTPESLISKPSANLPRLAYNRTTIGDGNSCNVSRSGSVQTLSVGAASNEPAEFAASGGPEQNAR